MKIAILAMFICEFAKHTQGLYSWRGINTPRLCRGYKGIKPESNTL
jgi:hypothetical protein